MRNLKQYPINDSDIQWTLIHALSQWKEQEHLFIGSVDGIVLTKIHEFFGAHPEVMQQLVDFVQRK